MISGERPNSVSEMLAELADWLDEADRLIDALARLKGIKRRNSGDDIQRDMRRLAHWFSANPDDDEIAFEYVRREDDQ